MYQYNKLSDFQYARFQILAVYLQFGLFWSGGIPTMVLVHPDCTRYIFNDDDQPTKKG